MQTITIRTTQNVLIEYPIAGLLDRIFAFLIDAVIIFAYVILVVVFLAAVQTLETWLMILFYLPAFFYDLAFEVAMNGQTPGKRALNIKVVRVDGTNPTIANYLLRWILRPIDIVLYGAIAITCILLTRHGQRLGDIAAGTTVIKMVAAGEVTSQQILSALEEQYEPVFAQVTQLSDKDIDLIKQALIVNREHGNLTPVIQLTAKIKEMLGIQTDMAPVKFLYTIIKDYSYLTSGKR